MDKIKETIADKIAKEWYWFKICEGCENIIDTIEPVCPICKSYRYNEERKDVIKRIYEVYDRFQSFIDNGLEQLVDND